MTKQEFINEVAGYVQKYAKNYGIKIYSPIIAQACKESGFGTSELATKAHNILGIKLKKGRTPIATGGYDKASGEYYNGVYSTPVSTFAVFKNWEDCVVGYFQFITSSSRYNCLKGLTNYEDYCKNLQECGYATSPTYADSLINDYIKKYDLTKYDKNEVNNMSNFTNSSLVNYTKISPNKTENRNHKIDTITIHCVVGQVTAERLGDIFANKDRKASSNYGVDKDGRIGLYVEEKDRSWCSSNAANDNRAITIEVASDTTEPYAVTAKAYEGLIKLVADICKRNGITKLVWSTNKDDRVNHLNGCNMTVHRDYAAKSCPGKYLYDRHQDIANRVNALLGSAVVEPIKKEVFNYTTTYKTTADLHLRESYNTNSKSIAVIPKGAEVKADSTKAVNGWLPIQFNGKCGYSYSEYLSKVQEQTTTTKLYRVQCGAFANPKNAEAYQAKIKAAGFDCIIKKVNNLYKCQCGAFKNKQNAEKYQAQLKAKGFNTFIVEE